MLAAERGAARNTLLAYQADLDDFAAVPATQARFAGCDAALLQSYMAGLQRAGAFGAHGGPAPVVTAAVPSLPAARRRARGRSDIAARCAASAKEFAKYLGEQEVDALLAAAASLPGRRGALAKAAFRSFTPLAYAPPSC